MNFQNQPDKLDRILRDEDPLLPSSGFAASVMDAIEQESLVPAPLPFPWKLALPGFLALIAALIGLVRYATLAFRNLDIVQVPNIDWLAWLQSSTQTAVLLRTAAAPALLALAVSFACLILCRRLAAGPSTLR